MSTSAYNKIRSDLHKNLPNFDSLNKQQKAAVEDVLENFDEQDILMFGDMVLSAVSRNCNAS